MRPAYGAAGVTTFGFWVAGTAVGVGGVYPAVATCRQRGLFLVQVAAVFGPLGSSDPPKRITPAPSAACMFDQVGGGPPLEDWISDPRLPFHDQRASSGPMASIEVPATACRLCKAPFCELPSTPALGSLPVLTWTQVDPVHWKRQP